MARFQIQGAPVAEHDELADLVAAAAGGFGVYQGGELVGAPRPGRDGLDRPGPVGDKLGQMTCSTVDSLYAVARVGGQQPEAPASPEPYHRGADGQLHRPQILAGRTECADGHLGQAGYLRRELRFDLLGEPAFSASVSAEGETVSATFGGRASQMATLTSTISSDSAAKRW